MGVTRAHCVEVEAVVGWLPDSDGDVVRAIGVDVVRNSDKLKESVADVEGECPFLRLFPGFHELVHRSGEGVEDLTLDFGPSVGLVEVGADGHRQGVWV